MRSVKLKSAKLQYNFILSDVNSKERATIYLES